jgi:hypothetical protein
MARSRRLEITPLSGELVAALLAEFDQILAKSTNAVQEHLLHLVVKQVPVHSREPIEIWYAVPNGERPEDDAPGDCTEFCVTGRFTG